MNVKYQSVDTERDAGGRLRDRAGISGGVVEEVQIVMGWRDEVEAVGVAGENYLSPQPGSS